MKDVGKVASAPVHIAVEAVKDPKKLIDDIGHIAKDVVKIAKFVLEQAAGLSRTPGIGTAISVAIAAGLAALEGGSALEIAIKIAYGAIPIPPGIKAFTDLVLGAVLDSMGAILKDGDHLKIWSDSSPRSWHARCRTTSAPPASTCSTALQPTVLQALMASRHQSLDRVTATAAVASRGLPSVSSITSAAAAAVPGLPPMSIPGVSGALGDKVDDFVTQLKSQYAGLNLPANVKQATDPIFNALVSMVHSMDVGPAILLAVRTGITSKLPSGAARDVGMHVFDTLAHLILGKLFHHNGPTQAKVSGPPLSKTQLTAVHLAAASGQPLPANVTPIPHTAAAYKPLAKTEKANSTMVSVAVPSAIGVTVGYGPYPQPASGGASVTTTAPAMAPPSVPAAPTSAPAATAPPATTQAPAGTTAGVGNLDCGGGHGGGGGRGGGGGGHPGGRGGYGALRPNYPRGSAYGWGGRGGWGGGPWWPYVVAAADDVACATWGAPIHFPPELSTAVRGTLSDSNWTPVAVRGSDGGLYRLSLDDYSRRVTVRPCVAVGVGSADDDVLKAMALDLLGEVRRTGAPQGATRSVKNFAQAWNAASADQTISTDGKYTQETAAALNAALSALSPGSGAAPAAVL